MILRADLHIHSAASKDGRHDLPRLLAAAKKAGLDAIAVCDHEKCTPVPADADPLLIPGTEISTDAGHILGLFLERPVELDRRGGLPTAEDAIAAIHAAGGVAVLAHPFQRPGADAERLSRLPADAVETANARAAMKVADANGKAARLADAMGLPRTGGSDAHGASEIGSCYTELDAPARTLPALRAALLAGGTPVFCRGCTWKRKARSQWTRARRSGSPLRMGKAAVYFAAAILRDLKRRS